QHLVGQAEIGISLQDRIRGNLRILIIRLHTYHWIVCAAGGEQVLLGHLNIGALDLYIAILAQRHCDSLLQRETKLFVAVHTDAILAVIRLIGLAAIVSGLFFRPLPKDKWRSSKHRQEANYYKPIT